MARLGFLFHMERCIACKTCQIACKDRKNLEDGSYFRRVETMLVKTGQGERLAHYSGACNHCDSPACALFCPTGAMHKADDGTVIHDRGKCIGCGCCVWSCPFGAASISKRHGCSQKCDACADLRKRGLPPACVDACPTRALEFGDLAALEAEYGPGLARGLSILPAVADTRPSLLIRQGERK